jgi:hypothetical protein
VASGADTGLKNLLELNGETIVFDNGMWVKFVAFEVAPTDARPHGIGYSLTLHDKAGERVFGIDNAHAARPGKGPSAKSKSSDDHMHVGKSTRVYRFVDAGTLLEDFWARVDELIGE